MQNSCCNIVADEKCVQYIVGAWCMHGWVRPKGGHPHLTACDGINPMYCTMCTHLLTYIHGEN